MVKYRLEDLLDDVNRNPKVKEVLFRYHATNGRFGGQAATAVQGSAAIAAARMTEYQAKSALASARAVFDNHMGLEPLRKQLLDIYLDVYSRERNQRNMRNGLRRAGAAVGIGLVAVIVGILAEPKAAKIVLETAGAASAAAGIAGAPILYFKYRA